jgi:uncharacterized membrane protein YbhN (UPF0104 family)
VKARLKNYLKFVLKLVVTAGALYFVYTRIDIFKLTGILAQSNFLILFIAMIIFIVSKIISAYRLNLFFKPIGINISSESNLKLYLLGMYYNLFLPGGIGGDGYKIYLLNRKFGVKVKTLFWATMFDRLSGVMALINLAAIMTFFISRGFPFQNIVWIIIPVSYFIFFLVIYFFFKEFRTIIHKTNLQSLIVQAAQTVSALLILYSAGIDDHIIEYLFVFLISSVVATLPVTIGGIGTREVTFLFGARILNLDTNASIALSLMFYIITAVVSFAGIRFSFHPGKILNKEDN